MKNKILLILILSSSLFSKSISLSKAYEIGLINSKKVLEAKYSLEAKKEDINQVKSSLYPQINFNASYNDSKRELNSLLKRTNYEEKERSKDYAISLNQKLYDAKTYASISLEKQKAELSKNSYKMKQQELLDDVSKAYVNILNQKNKILYAQSNLKYSEYYFNLVEKKHKNKLASKIELIENKLKLQKAKVELKKELALLEVVTEMFNLSIGTKGYDVLDIAYSNISYADIMNLKDEINGETSYLNSLKINEAKISSEFAKKEIKLAKSSHYPTLNFNIKYTKFDSEDLTSDYEDRRDASISFNLPLYEGGLTSSKILSAKLKAKAKKTELELVKFRSKISIRELQIVFNSLIEEYNINSESLELANINKKLVEDEFNKGLKSIIDVFEEKNKIEKIKFEYSNSLSKLIEVYTSLLRETNNFGKIYLLDKLFKK